MSTSEVKRQYPDRKILKRLPGPLSLILALSSFALGACQKPASPITAPIPGTGIILTFIPRDNDVGVYEFRADQPNKIMADFNLGDAINAYEGVNDINLGPIEAAKCADAIAVNNPVNLQPELVDSKGPSSARKVLAPEGGLTIPVDSCGNLKNNSTPIAPSAPMPTQTSVPIATPQTQGTEALINNENMGIVFGTLCASILGIGAMLFGGLRTFRGRNPKNNNNDGLKPVQLKRLPSGTVVLDERVVNLSGQKRPVLLDLGDGQGERLVDFRPQVLVADTQDPKLMQRVLTALAKKIKRSDPEIIRGPVAPLMYHEGKHAGATDAAMIGFLTEHKPDGTPQIIGAAVKDVNPNPTPAQQRKMFLAPEDPSPHDKRNATLAAEEMIKKEKKK